VPPLLCGNGALDAGEACDGLLATACPGACLTDCTCARTIDLPLDGWSLHAGAGTWNVDEADPESGGAVLVTATETAPSTAFGVAYPATETLGVGLPILGFTVRDDDAFDVEVVVRPANGKPRTLRYTARDGVPTARHRTGVFPIGVAAADGVLRTTYRDLAADLQSAFGARFARVEQVRLYGDLTAARVMLAAPEVVDVPAPSALRVPTSGWERHGRGVVHETFEPMLDALTLTSTPDDPAGGGLRVTYPALRDGRLVAAAQTLSFVVRDERRFVVRVRVRPQRGPSVVLRYRSADHAGGSALPLTLRSVPGTPYQLATLDLAADLARVRPGATLAAVLGIRLDGGFRVGDVELLDPLP
jgi:hypothetical protein